jgi:hypothetical protein
MARGRLIPPNLDDRTWQDIVDQARGLIPTYAPEWTDHNPSDLGMTLIELFAWLMESLTYRLNRVPDNNFTEFLNLIGVTRDPATPASTFLTYRSAPGTPPLLVPKGSQAATQQTETDAAIVFETDQDFTVLPINLTTALHIRKVGLTNRYQDVTAELVGSPLSGLALTIPPSQSITFTLGFDLATTDTIRLRCHFFEPVEEGQVQITWLYSRGTAAPFSWPTMSSVNDETEVFQKNGVVSFTVPGDWASQNPQAWSIPADSAAEAFNQPRFWIGIRVSNLLTQPLALGLTHILFNSAPATNALTIIQPELLGLSNGKPFQFFELQNPPLFKRPRAKDPYDHLLLQVREPQVGGSFGPWTNWNHLDDFPAGSGLYFRLNPVSGTINFGNYDPVTSADGHGSIPPLDSEIRAVSYRYVAGGSEGNVPSDKINVIRTPLAGLVSVTNPGPATGGSAEEAIEETKRRGPEVLRNCYRAVTVEDYEYLAREATTDVKKVRCLPPRLFTSYDTLPLGANVGDPWTYGSLNRSVNNANVIIIPDAPLSNPTPMPSEELLQEVSDYLEERRVLTNLLHVTFPRYLPINVTVNLRIWQQALDTALVPSLAQVETDVRGKIIKFLHPLLGGPEEKGWEVGQDIVISSLLDLIQPETEIGFVEALTVQAPAPLYQPPERPFSALLPSVWVQLADYEMICSGTHTVTVSAI